MIVRASCYYALLASWQVGKLARPFEVKGAMTDSMALVTGAPGWLASRLLECLLHGIEGCRHVDYSPERRIRVLTLPALCTAPSTTPDIRPEVVPGDLVSGDGLSRLFLDAEGATVFHCAGIVHPAYQARQFYDINVQGTKNLLNAARLSGIRRFISVSSDSAMGLNPTHDHLFDETGHCDPYMGYGKSKKLAEDLVNEAGARGWFETVVIRPCWFYGPNQPARQTLFFNMIRAGKAPLVGSGLNRRSMSYIDNVCQGLMLCEQVAGARGQTYWIADRRPYAFPEIIDTVERLLEDEFEIPVAHKRLRLPGFVSELALGADAVMQAAGFYNQKVHVLSQMNKSIACSIDKAQRELGYDPKIELEEGMRRSIAWMLGRTTARDLALVASS